MLSSHGVLSTLDGSELVENDLLFRKRSLLRFAGDRFKYAGSQDEIVCSPGPFLLF